MASKHIPYFSSPLTAEDVDEICADWPSWIALRAQLRPDDRIHPFAVNVDTMAMRLGYVVLRNGKPIGGVGVVVS